MSGDEQCLILLVKLEQCERWRSNEQLQEAILSVIDLVNTAHDITGISTAGLFVDYWGREGSEQIPVISFLVVCDDRYGDEDDTDDMIFKLFAKSIKICGYGKDMRVLTPAERRGLDAG